jgi:hypothetical protein
VGLGDGADDGQAEARPAAVGAGGDEAPEEPLLHVAADLALVLDGDRHLAVAASDLDAHAGALRPVGARVVDEVVDGP